MNNNFMYNTKTIVDWLLKNDILQIGIFVLKSGRGSKYFFNCGNINKGGVLPIMGLMYQQHLTDILGPIDEDIVVFGSAYKAIPICVIVSQVLDTMNKARSAYYCFDRKEDKTHGDVGKYVGKDMNGRPVVIVDDVLTSGGSILSAKEFIEKNGGRVIGACVLIDRMEEADRDRNGKGIVTAREVISKQMGVPVNAVIDVYRIAETLIDSEQHVEAAHEMLKNIGREYATKEKSKETD